MRFVCAVLAGLLGSATAALTDCNPPPPGLSINQWADVCTTEINYAYQRYGGGMDFNYFVESLYGMYQNPPPLGGNSGITPMASCAPEGITQCNSSGWLYT